VILRLLALLILGYRRWLSGRGPLRRVRCSFAAQESCSAFGLRITRIAASARDAIGRIVRRLRRCRDACLVADGTRITWAPIHDQPPEEIARGMRSDGEHDAAVARMLQTRRAVARWCGDLDAFRACVPALPGHPPLVRSRARR
jgi:putative component of membrane protein insertase Oxa1/YidC/SpoIIIJ protein YidD